MKTSNFDPIAESMVKIMQSVQTIPEDVEASRVAQEDLKAKQQAKEKADELFAASGVPERHANQSLSGSNEWYRAWDRVKVVLGKGAIIPLVGTRGSGKTQLSVEAIRYVTGRGHQAVYIKAMGFFLDIRDAMRDKDRGEKEAIKRFVVPRLLVIDAMEVRGETDFENRILDYVIDLRYDAGKDTILISNQKREEFKNSLGLSIVSRVREMGEVVECNWQSFREPNK